MIQLHERGSSQHFTLFSWCLHLVIHTITSRCARVCNLHTQQWRYVECVKRVKIYGVTQLARPWFADFAQSLHPRPFNIINTPSAKLVGIIIPIFFHFYKLPIVANTNDGTLYFRAIDGKSLFSFKINWMAIFLLHKWKICFYLKRFFGFAWNCHRTMK